MLTCHIALLIHKLLVEPGQCFNEEIGALVAKLVAARREQVDGLVEVKVEMAVEVTMHELFDFCFAKLINYYIYRINII